MLEHDTGLVVKAHSPVELETALTRLCHDQELRRALGRRAREHVKQRYGVSGFVSAFEQLLRQLAGAGSR